MKRVLIICGTGIATSTVVASKVRDHLQEVGLQASVDQGKVTKAGWTALAGEPVESAEFAVALREGTTTGPVAG